MFARAGILVIATSSLFAVSTTVLPPQYLPIVGGGGGSGYTRSCGAGKVVTGLQYRAGMLVDAIGVLCRSVSASGALGTQQATGTLAGGSQGTSGSLSCASGKVLTRVHVYFGTYVDGMRIECSTWNPSTREYDEPRLVDGKIGGGTLANRNTQSCESRAQPVNGIRGRASGVVDAIGIICDEP